LKKKFNIPWLADFRDPWTEIDFYQKLQLTKWANNKHLRLEKEVLSTADRISIVSWNWAIDFNRLYPRHYNVITNGYDPDDFNITGQKISDSFELTHIGSLNKDRNPELLWGVLSEICSEDEKFRDDLHLRFIGKCDISLTQCLEKYGLLSRTSMIEYMPHDEVLKESAGSQVLLLLLNNTPNVMGIVPGKIFEYLATRRPILCIGPTNGDSARIIREATAGITCDFDDKTAIKKGVLELYGLFKQGLLQNQAGEIDSFSRKGLTGKISALLNELFENKAKKST
jgi:glycosyltransferase involved in cell wall biosynthesis